ncbi:hypothetical protein Syun_012950 [Stephania yunnanensis]|uniref:Uncharacterized protein n=1 Tax=Stephania yunnanensis TaxID=152371 RepID=A0AAP0K2M3_9MAGN
MKMKRKDPEEVVDDFTDFYLTSPASKIRDRYETFESIFHIKYVLLPFLYRRTDFFGSFHIALLHILTEIEIEKLRPEHIKLVQENDGLHLEKQKKLLMLSRSMFLCSRVRTTSRATLKCTSPSSSLSSAQNLWDTFSSINAAIRCLWENSDHSKEMEEKTTCPNLSFFYDYITANMQHFKDPPTKQVGRVNQSSVISDDTSQTMRKIGSPIHDTLPRISKCIEGMSTVAQACAVCACNMYQIEPSFNRSVATPSSLQPNKMDCLHTTRGASIVLSSVSTISSPPHQNHISAVLSYGFASRHRLPLHPRLDGPPPHHPLTRTSSPSTTSSKEVPLYCKTSSPYVLNTTARPTLRLSTSPSWLVLRIAAGRRLRGRRLVGFSMGTCIKRKHRHFKGKTKKKSLQKLSATKRDLLGSNASCDYKSHFLHYIKKKKK